MSLRNATLERSGQKKWKRRSTSGLVFVGWLAGAIILLGLTRSMTFYQPTYGTLGETRDNFNTYAPPQHPLTIFGQEWLRNTSQMHLNYSGLIGTIPTSLGRLTELTTLYLHSNALSGTIPTEIGMLTLMTGLELYENHLSGSLPTELSKASDLKQLKLWGNQLTGNIPTSLCSTVRPRIDRNGTINCTCCD